MKSNKAILKQANAAISKGNIEAFLSACTDDTVWEYIGDKTLVGKQAVREYLKQAYTDSSSFNISLMIEEGDFVTQMGKISFKEESGEIVDYLACDVWKFREGKMAELKAFVIRDNKNI